MARLSKRLRETRAWAWRSSAFVAGYKVSLFVPEGFAEEKCILMRGFGATVERTPEDEGMQGAIRRALDFARSIPGAWMARQFDNPANPDFHFQTTAQEILDQMENRIDGFVAGVGTGGTFTGIARRLRQDLGAVKTVAVETEGSVLQGGTPGKHKVEGIGVSFIPKTFDGSLCDSIVRVTDRDAFAMVKRLATKKAFSAAPAPVRTYLLRWNWRAQCDLISALSRSFQTLPSDIFRRKYLMAASKNLATSHR